MMLVINCACIINDDNEFENSYNLHLKCEHMGIHATFLGLDITIKDGVLIYKLIDKRDASLNSFLMGPFLLKSFASHMQHSFMKTFGKNLVTCSNEC